MRAGVLALLAAIPITLGGCGGGTGTSSSTSDTAALRAARQAAAARARAEARAPKGSSPTLRAIYATFPPPQPDPEVKGSGAAIGAGERACAHKNPTQVKEELYAAAKPHLSPEQLQLIDRIARYEDRSGIDPGFVAGQLAADVYAATLPEVSARYGYQGCVYALVRGLERRLAPGG